MKKKCCFPDVLCDRCDAPANFLCQLNGHVVPCTSCPHGKWVEDVSTGQFATLVYLLILFCAVFRAAAPGLVAVLPMWDSAYCLRIVGLRLSDEAIRVAVAHRLGCKACEPHTCACGKAVDARGLHRLSCRRSAPRQQRHSHLNDIIWRAIKQAQMPPVKAAVSLIRDDNKRPDGDHSSAMGQRKTHGLGCDSLRSPT